MWLGLGVGGVDLHEGIRLIDRQCEAGAVWCGESHPRPAVVVAGEVGERVVDVLCTDLSSAAEVEVPGRDRGVTGGQTPIVGRQPPSGIQLQFGRVNEVGAGVQVGMMTGAVPAGAGSGPPML